MMLSFRDFPVLPLLEHFTLEMLAYGRQKPAYSHFVARIFRKILAEHLTHFIRKLLYPVTRSVSVYATVRARQAGQDVLIHVRVDGGAGRPARQPAVGAESRTVACGSAVTAAWAGLDREAQFICYPFVSFFCAKLLRYSSALYFCTTLLRHPQARGFLRGHAPGRRLQLLSGQYLKAATI